MGRKGERHRATPMEFILFIISHNCFVWKETSMSYAIKHAKLNDMLNQK